jgi:hypothetical protein
MASEQLILNFTSEDFSQFTVRSSWTDEEGFTFHSTKKSTDLSQEQLAGIAAIAEPIIAIKADWQAKQAIVSKIKITKDQETTELEGSEEITQEPVEAEAVSLIIIAEKERNGSKATRTFTKEDLPQLLLTEESQIQLFDSVLQAVIA